ncbi:hypothetical protein CA267_017255 [Alteromonas pelagimontana]|uniref:Uncharacterized protein n=1 Tax=Alteromonas pelagimontana TaxID=1858656 RepID=A0A6M4MH54_9ALTE|nr:hypothetical protein [Alteromonas pelagimontana]QJR82372.1 hypothetical protein CA267_017255 [Alteromonas pelagimontana]
MANDSRNEDFPTIRLDEEDRREYQKKKHTAAHTISSQSNKQTENADAGNSATSKSGNGLWIALVALVALLGCGGCYYLYTLLQQQQESAAQAETRIAQLEKRLSATGEEMGESTVALQVKVSEVTERTNNLWEQMDKLWASAWRRNQKEITELGDKLNSVQNSLSTSLNTVTDDVAAQKNQIASVKNQLASLADEILSLNVQMEQAAGDKQAQAQGIKNLADKLAVLEQRNNSLAGRISSMENEIREVATKVVSQPSPQG